MPKGPIFHVEPEPDSSEEDEKEMEQMQNNPSLNFADILTGMGGSGFMSSGNESEEESKLDRLEASGVRVFRPGGAKKPAQAAQQASLEHEDVDDEV